MIDCAKQSCRVLVFFWVIASGTLKASEPPPLPNTSFFCLDALGILHRPQGDPYVRLLLPHLTDGESQQWYQQYVDLPKIDPVLRVVAREVAKPNNLTGILSGHIEGL